MYIVASQGGSPSGLFTAVRGRVASSPERVTGRAVDGEVVELGVLEEADRVLGVVALPVLVLETGAEALRVPEGVVAAVVGEGEGSLVRPFFVGEVPRPFLLLGRTNAGVGGASAAVWSNSSRRT